jgi:hypothetical protein
VFGEHADIGAEKEKMRHDKSHAIEALALIFCEMRTIPAGALPFSTLPDTSKSLPLAAHFDTHPPALLCIAKRPHGTSEINFKRRKSALEWHTKPRNPSAFSSFCSLRATTCRDLASQSLEQANKPPLHYYHHHGTL